MKNLILLFLIFILLLSCSEDNAEIAEPETEYEGIWNGRGISEKNYFRLDINDKGQIIDLSFSVDYGFEEYSFRDVDENSIEKIAVNGNSLNFTGNRVYIPFLQYSIQGTFSDINSFSGTYSVVLTANETFEDSIILTRRRGWERIEINTSEHFGYDAHVQFPTPDIGYILAGKYWNTQLLKSNDGGHNWINVLPSSFVDSIYVMNMFMINENICYLTGQYQEEFYDSTLFITSTNGGNTWNIKAFPMLEITPYVTPRSIFFLNQGIGYIVYDEVIIKTDDSGGEFNQWLSLEQLEVNIGISDFDKMNFIEFLDENIGYLVIDNCHILSTTNGGLDWNLLVENSDFPINSENTCFFDNQNVIVGGIKINLNPTYNGIINSITLNSVSTINSVRNKYKAENLDNAFLAIDYFNNNNCVFVGVDGTIARSYDGGETIHFENYGYWYYTLSSVCFMDENRLIAVGQSHLPDELGKSVILIKD